MHFSAVGDDACTPKILLLSENELQTGNFLILLDRWAGLLLYDKSLILIKADKEHAQNHKPLQEELKALLKLTLQIMIHCHIDEIKCTSIAGNLPTEVLSK